jgi:hypothetical protein
MGGVPVDAGKDAAAAGQHDGEQEGKNSFHHRNKYKNSSDYLVIFVKIYSAWETCTPNWMSGA